MCRCAMPGAAVAPRSPPNTVPVVYRYDPNVRRTDDDEYPGTGTY